MHKDDLERELNEELRYHVEREEQLRIRNGSSVEEAHLAALKSFGGLEQSKEECRDARGVRLIEDLWQDLRYGARMLIKNPGFTAVAVIALALGIGANTAIFTLFSAVLLKPLPVPAPEELVLFDDTLGEGTTTGDPSPEQWHLFSSASYKYFRDHSEAFQSLCAFRSGESRLSVRRPGGSESTERAQAHLVSGNYFDVMRIKPLLGRNLSESDDTPSASPSAVISYGYWKQQLNGDSAIVGQSIILNETSFTIAGVMPPEFFGERVRKAPDLWVPLAFQPQIERSESFLEDQKVYWLTLMGRLKPGVSLQQAQTAVNTGLKQFQFDQAGSSITEERRKEISGSYVQFVDGSRGISGLRFMYARPLWMLMVVVILVLLIACANVGNLLLARSTARQSEISLRLALGATRFRLIRQLLTESVLLAVLGGLCGVLLARWGVSVLVTLVAKTSPLNVSPDALTLSFTIGISLLAGLLFGLAPAIRTSNRDLTAGLKERSRTSGHGRFGLAPVLVVSQVVLSMVLLTGSVLFARSLMKLAEEEVGFNRDNVLLVGIDPRLAGYKPAQLSSFYRELLDQVSALPGVRSATLATYSPMSGSNRSSSVTVDGFQPRQGEDMSVSDILAGPKYCETFGVPVLLGREFTLNDTEAGQKVAVVNKAFADYYYGDANPIGKRIHFGDDEKDAVSLEIVGVIGNMKFQNARNKPLRTVYRPILQIGDSQALTSNLEIRTLGDPASLTPSVRQVIERLDSKLPIFGVTTLREQFSGTVKQEQLIAEIVGFFGLLALFLSCVGLYGLMAHAVARRTNEIGIRMALGADRRGIVWMVLRESLLLVFVGVTIGIPAALVAGRLVASQLFGMTSTDPVSLFGAAILLLAVAALAGFIPALRASRVDPMVALRYE